ncbi:MAG: phosphate ABC transporter substrate-binding protein [Burkholderiales bacterium]|jgi:ABC-type phosphate transport system substrate-binding protein|nr:phosphate ABC transporter substrate-binding protein [Burkholderiales bacterium]
MMRRSLILASVAAFAGWLPSPAAFAQSSLVVVVNRSVPVERLDSSQATQIFLRQVTTWPDGSRVQPVDLAEGSPLRTEFYSRVTGRSPGQLRAYWARLAFTGMGLPPREVATVEEVRRFVRSTPGAIGYVDRRENDPELKVVLELTP